MEAKPSKKISPYYMSDYIDFLLYGSLENSDSDDSDYYPSGSQEVGYGGETSTQFLQSERTLTLKLYHNYYIYGL